MPIILEAIDNFYDKPRDKERQIGHYHCSELWSIYKGYTNPTNFFTQKPFDDEGKANCFRGSAMEDRLAFTLKEQGIEFESQERLEMEIAPDIFLSGKTDFSFPEYILETKCPRDPTTGIPDKWKFQLESYYRMSNKPVYLGIFPKTGSKIIRFWKYEPDINIWNTIGQTLLIFHTKLCKKYNKK